MFRNLFLVAALVLLPLIGFADGGSFGALAERLSAPVKAIENVFSTVSLLFGVAVTMGGLFQFKKHRDNPSEVPFSKALVVLLAGLVLLAMPFILDIYQQSLQGTEFRR